MSVTQDTNTGTCSPAIILHYPPPPQVLCSVSKGMRLQVSYFLRQATNEYAPSPAPPSPSPTLPCHPLLHIFLQQRQNPRQPLQRLHERPGMVFLQGLPFDRIVDQIARRIPGTRGAAGLPVPFGGGGGGEGEGGGEDGESAAAAVGGEGKRWGEGLLLYIHRLSVRFAYFNTFSAPSPPRRPRPTPPPPPHPRRVFPPFFCRVLESSMSSTSGGIFGGAGSLPSVSHTGQFMI